MMAGCVMKTSDALKREFLTALAVITAVTIGTVLVHLLFL
jgi:hypothetical protein